MERDNTQYHEINNCRNGILVTTNSRNEAMYKLIRIQYAGLTCVTNLQQLMERIVQ